MPGLYDNELGQYVDVEWLREGQWLLSIAGELYIIPTDDSDIEGPDGDTLDALNRICRECAGQVSLESLEELGLEEVPDILKRFDRYGGYYTA